jgi:cytoplasmic iron level regulating protein YaaA (DUF328/UPF0246 family)
MYILLPASEAKAVGGALMNPLQDNLTVFRNIISNELLLSPATNLSKNPITSELFHLLNSKIAESTELMPVWERYQGVVYRFLNLSKSDPLDLLYICSPYLGIAAANSNIPNYKLSYTSSVGQIGKLSNFWSKNLPLHEIFPKESVFLDLLTNSQRLLFSYPPGSIVYQIDFLNKDRKLIGHLGKQSKGIFLRQFINYDLSLSKLKSLATLSNAKITVKRF